MSYTKENAMFLDRIRATGTDAAKQLIPSATQNGVESMWDAFYTDGAHTHANQGAFNDFAGMLSQFMGGLALYTYDWNGPFEQFVSTEPFGEAKIMAAQETGKVHDYDPFKSNLLTRRHLKMHTKLAPINFAAQNEATISEDNIRGVMSGEASVSTLISDQMNKLTSSDRIATYNKFKDVVANGLRGRGFSNVYVPFADIERPTAAELTELSRQVRIYRDRLSMFPSAEYNAGGVTYVSNPDDLRLIVDPVVKNSMVVSVLADAFNRDDRKFREQLVEIDHMPFDTHAILFDRKWLNEFRRYRYIDNTPFDPTTRSFNVVVNHVAAIATNPFMPAIAMSNSKETKREVINVVPPTEFKAQVTDETGAVVTTVQPHRHEYYLEFMPTNGSVDPKHPLIHLPREHDVLITAPDDPKAINARTLVDIHGRIHFQKRIKEGIKLLFTITTDANDNPSDSLDEAKQRESIQVTTSVTVGPSTPTPPAQPTLTTLSIGGDSKLAFGASTKLSAVGTYDDGTTQDLTDKASWEVDSSGVLTTDYKGTVTGAKAGTGYVTCNYGQVRSEMHQIDVAAAALKSVALTSSAATVGVNKTVQLKATGTYEDKSTKDLTADTVFASSDLTLATVDAKGVVTGVKAGDVKVTGKADGVAAPDIALKVTA